MSRLIVNNLSKSYSIYKSEWHRIARWLYISTQQSAKEHWVLQNINFIINSGEAVGIVGNNGAGKSTLLKIITGTLQPTTGHVRLNGRISAILELGMGFNPELTGRQNTYFTAALMGFDKQQIDQVMPDIENFSEIGDYFDKPMHTYSSGMQMRVAFSVATAFRPEILIVDEALSVGDAYFQHKSFERIREFQQQGTTLLIVSHDRSAIQALCTRAILLDHGCITKDGNPEEVMDFYNAMIAEKENTKIALNQLDNKTVQTLSGTGEARIKTVNLYNKDNSIVEFTSVGEAISLRITIDIIKNIPELVLGYMIKDRLGQPVFGTNTHHLGCPLFNLSTGEHIEYHFNFPANLGVGSYSIAVALHTQDNHITHNYEWRDFALVFNVVNTSKDSFVGLAWIPPEVKYYR